MPRKEWLVGAFILVLLAGLSLVWLAPPPGEPAPEVRFNVLDGEPIALDSMRGEPVLIQFWATDCTTCVSEMPDLIALHNALDAEGLNLIGVAMDYDPAERVRRLVARKALPYTIALDDGGAIANAFNNVRVTPTTVLIGADGRVIWQRIGKLDFERLGEEIAREIAKGNTA